MNQIEKDNFYIRLLKRPVAVAMLFLGLLFLGLIALTRLKVDLLPDMAYPRIIIFTEAEGLSAEEVENRVLNPVESLLSSLPQVKSMEGLAEDGFALVVLTFTRLSSIDTAIIVIKEKLASFRDFDPLIMHHDPNAKPVAVLSLTAGNTGIDELTSLAEEVLARRLNQIEGVGRVSWEGGAAIRRVFTLNDEAVKESGILPGDLVSVLETSLEKMGVIREGRNSYPLRLVKGSGEKTEELPVPGSSMLLGDIGYWETETEQDGVCLFNGKPGVALIIEKRYGANTLDVVRRLKDIIPDLSQDISSQEGQNIELSMAFHEAGFIQDAMNSVISALTIGSFLTLVVLFFCLGSFRQTLAVGISIPLSVICSFLVFYLAQISLNIMSLGGLSLGIGMMVDNSIVVSEAVHRQMKLMKGRRNAVDAGVREVAAPVTASTLTTIAVFLPILFLSGTVAKLFADLAIAVTVSLLLSLLISLSLLPVLLGAFGSYGRFGKQNSFFWKKWESLFSSAIVSLNRKGGIVIILFCLCFLLSLPLGFSLRRELIPDSGQNRLLINMEVPPGNSLSDLVTGMETLSAALLSEAPGNEFRNEIETVWVNAGRNNDSRFGLSFLSEQKGYIRVSLQEKADSDHFIKGIKKIVERSDLLKSFSISIEKESNPLEEVLRFSARQIRVRVTGHDRASLAHSTEKLVYEIEQRSGVVPIEVNGLEKSNIGRISFNTAFLNDRGISSSALENLLVEILKGSYVTRENELIHIRYPLPENRNLEELIVNLGGQSYPLNALIDFEAGSGDKRIYHLDKKRLAEIVYPDEEKKNTLSHIRNFIRNGFPAMDKNIRIELGGEEEEIANSFRELGFAFTLALILVYMIMAAQFESLKYPLIIIITVPMAGIGIMFLFYLFNQSINMMSLIGTTMALGIVINDSIILTSATLEISRKGESGAPFKAAVRRFRPIIITSLTTIAGMLPMALGREAAARLRSPLALAVIGGLTSATILTLFIQPLIFSRLMAPPEFDKE